MTEQTRAIPASRGGPHDRLALPAGAAALWNQAIEDLSASSTVLVGESAGGDREALAQTLLGEDYEIVHVQDGGELLAVSGRRDIHLLILDANLQDSFGLCQAFKASTRARPTPVLMMLHDGDVAAQIRALDSGADELIAKPFHPDLFRTRVRSMLRQKTSLDQLEQTENILFALARAVEKRDLDMGDHCERIATFSVALGMSLGLPRQHLLALYRGGYLHDIGKVAIPDRILFKPGHLEPDEWAVMKTHTVKGEEICRSLKSLSPVLPIIRNHHERWDGSGYPDGLAGSSIPLLARILQIADVYDALTSARSYKNPLKAEDALAIMQGETDRGWRDPALMSEFRKLHESAVLGAAAAAAMESSDLDGVRKSLRNLSRQLGAMGRAACTAWHPKSCSNSASPIAASDSPDAVPDRAAGSW